MFIPTTILIVGIELFVDDWTEEHNYIDVTYETYHYFDSLNLECTILLTPTHIYNKVNFFGIDIYYSNKCPYFSDPFNSVEISYDKMMRDYGDEIG